MNISRTTMNLLIKSGWNEDRNIDISEYEKALNKDGYYINSTIRKFLKEFGGLLVYHPHAKLKNEIDFFHFNPIESINSIFKERIESYEDRINEKLTVIGEAYSNHMALIMSESGKIYAGYDDLLLLIGNDYSKALETLCEGKETIRIN